MARIFITGSADGLGLLSAQALVAGGHKVVLHGRNAERGAEAIKKTPAAENVFTGDLSNVEETKDLAQRINKSGGFDAIIHNVGVYRAPAQQIFTVNTLAPYVLTCLIRKPKRLVYLTSGLHSQGRPNLEKFSANSHGINYSDSKLHVLMLAIAISRKWQDVYANAVNPGWVPTKMGGHGASDDLQKGYETQVWLATSEDDKAKVSGRYFFHQQERPHNPLADDVVTQENFLKRCAEITGVEFPK
jgi:NAD(P)-dependent dehydrogenase (short-subunit alcohol dehydrogenase family)